jgi:Recombination endonuclease VII
MVQLSVGKHFESAVCIRCNTTQPRDQFYTRLGKLGGTRLCLACRQSSQKGLAKRQFKACLGCGVVKPRSDFHPKKTIDYVRNKIRYTIRERCKPCASIAQSRVNRAKSYRLTLTQVDEMMSRPCQICGSKQLGKHGLGIDHSHKTGKVRGTLCGACNKGIGFFKDDPRLLAAAIEYLSLAEG